MKRQAAILLTVAALIAALVVSATPALAIIGGAFDGNRHPYVGALDLRPTGRRIPCTGTLISPTVFLTAGHCTAFLDQAGLTQARVTFDPLFSDNARFYTGSVHTNPLYTRRAAEGRSARSAWAARPPRSGLPDDRLWHHPAAGRLQWRWAAGH